MLPSCCHCLFSKIAGFSILEDSMLIRALFSAVILSVGLLVLDPVGSESPARADDKSPDCCKAKLACCSKDKACCAAPTKLGCCEKGMKCCAKDAACCAAVQDCCRTGAACCDEVKACCG